MNFITDRLVIAGKINRRDIMDAFEVSAPQAAADFRRFEKEHPGEMRYDSRAKAYVRSTPGTRDIGAAASWLIGADDADLEMIAHRDPGMIRDVAAALIATRN